MTSTPVVTVAFLRVNVYEVIARAVEEGCQYGVRRAYKHTDTPDQDTIAAECEQAVMNALAEVLDYGDEE